MKANFIITILISAIVSSLIGFALQKQLEKYFDGRTKENS